MKSVNLLKRIILILIIIILLIVLIINIIQIKDSISKKAVQEGKYSKSEQFILDDISEELVRPQFSGLVLMKYKGSASQEEVIRKFYDLAIKLIPTYYEMFDGKNDSEIKKYYNISENKKYLRKQLGITSYDSFEIMQHNIRQLNGKKLIFKSYKFIKDSVVETEEGVKAKLTILYQDNEELQLEVLIKNNVQDEDSILMVL